ncbi:MAG: DUF4402 domain-containing protein [Bacteroidales bacterium]|nr:DUF4402 domain-containing protein [Bacteroidales bacterium]MDT8373714.1 DUF4402 domain-containing protein [Bacteroidales bacterium]
MTIFRRYLLSLFVLFVLYPGVTLAQTASAVSATGHITAQVITMLTAVETSQMNFGRFSPGPAGGELILTPENSVSVLGTVWPGSGTHNAASFYVTGDPGIAYTITLPAEPVTIMHMGTARTMTVDDWVSVPSATPGAGMLYDGAQTVYVGATLKVGTIHDNPVGIYTGTYTITFDFN